jgi:protein-S-isoprenylcysteine O-methyltransferase Ste14
MIEFSAFILLTIILLIITLKRPYRHRFFRFFAFVSLLGLILRQARAWFSDPFSFTQILSWIFLAGSAALAVHALRLLHAFGDPAGDIENTTVLVKRGAYRYIRHPLYASLLLLGVGAFLKRPDGVSLLIFIALAGFVVLTAWIEEKETLVRFGGAYERYIAETKMFIPYIY